jgi:hypothetical protein
MIAFRRVAISLTVVRVFLPNGDFRTRHAASCDPKAPLALAAARRDSLRAKPARPTTASDEQWVRLAASAPGGFAGAYLDPARSKASGTVAPQRLVVRLARPQERETALPVVLPKIREVWGPDAGRAGVLVEPARWDFAQLMDWSQYLDPHAHAVAKVLSADIDQAHNRLSYGVGTKAARETLLEHLGSLGIPCGLVEVVVTSPAGRA